MRCNDLEGHLWVQLFLRASLETTFFVRFRGPCCYHRHCCLGDGGLVFFLDFFRYLLQPLIFAGRARFSEKAACFYSHPLRMAAC